MKKHFSILEHSREHMPPVTFRLPPTGSTDPFFGCPRTFWNQRVLPNVLNNFKPAIKSIVVMTKGTKRGIRLVYFESAKAYFDTLAESQKTVSGEVNA